MKILEQITINFWGELFTIRQYTNGEVRCSCNKFKKAGVFEKPCYHIVNRQNSDFEMVEARRFR